MQWFWVENDSKVKIELVRLSRFKKIPIVNINAVECRFSSSEHLNGIVEM